MNKFGLIGLVLLIACLPLANAATAIILVVPQEPINNQTVNYGNLTLRVEGYLDDSLAPDLNVFAESELFGKVNLYDDGQHDDGANNDGIYANTVLINSGVGERHAIEFTASRETRFDKKVSYVNVTDSLNLAFVVPETAFLGETLYLTGQAFNAQNEVIDGTATVTFKSEDWQVELLIDSVEGIFLTDYLLALTLPTGVWAIDINVADEFGNSGVWQSALFVSAPVAEKVSPEFVEPEAGAGLPRAAAIPITIKATRRGEIVTGAQATMIYEGEEKRLGEVGHGYYSGHLELEPGARLGAKEICVEISKTTNNVKETERDCVDVFITNAEMNVEILELQEEYLLGEEYEFKIKVEYASGVPLNNADVYCQLTRAVFENEGLYACKLRFNEIGLTEPQITVIDAYGNEGRAETLVNVRYMTILEMISFFLLRYGWIILIIIAIAAYLYWNADDVKLKRLKKRKLGINFEITKIQTKFFKKKSMDNQEYDKLFKKYNQQLARVDEEIVALEEKIKKKEKKKM
jgi:hypothetical protein